MAGSSAEDWGEVLVVIDHRSYLQIVACLHWWNKDDSHDRRWNVWFTVEKSLVFHNNDPNSMIKLCTLRNHQVWWDLWVQLLVFAKLLRIIVIRGNRGSERLTLVLRSSRAMIFHFSSSLICNEHHESVTMRLLRNLNVISLNWILFFHLGRVLIRDGHARRENARLGNLSNASLS